MATRSCFETPPSEAPQHEVGRDRADARRSLFFVARLRFEIAPNLGRSQNLLDPFRFIESLVESEANVRSEFQVNAACDLAAKKLLIALERFEHRLCVA